MPQIDNFLVDAARAVRDKLPDNYAFIVLACPFNGEGDNQLVYISNAQRTDAINMLKEWLLKCGAAEDWMQHIK